MMNGTIKTLVREKGFGFIASEGQEKEVFFHQTAVNGVTYDELQEGDKVTFEMGEGKDGRPAAANVARA
jgi:CspA family cold shock protein